MTRFGLSIAAEHGIFCAERICYVLCYGRKIIYNSKPPPIPGLFTPETKRNGFLIKFQPQRTSKWIHKQRKMFQKAKRDVASL